MHLFTVSNHFTIISILFLHYYLYLSNLSTSLLLPFFLKTSILLFISLSSNHSTLFTLHLIYILSMIIFLLLMVPLPVRIYIFALSHLSLPMIPPLLTVSLASMYPLYPLYLYPSLKSFSILFILSLHPLWLSLLTISKKLITIIKIMLYYVSSS